MADKTGLSTLLESQGKLDGVIAAHAHMIGHHRVQKTRGPTQPTGVVFFAFSRGYIGRSQAVHFQATGSKPGAVGVYQRWRYLSFQDVTRLLRINSSATCRCANFQVCIASDITFPRMFSNIYRGGGASIAGLVRRSCRSSSHQYRSCAFRFSSPPLGTNSRSLFTTAWDTDVFHSATSTLSRLSTYANDSLHPAHKFWIIYLTLLDVIWPIYLYNNANGIDVVDDGMFTHLHDICSFFFSFLFILMQSSFDSNEI
jgi:hypothetical protein